MKNFLRRGAIGLLITGFFICMAAAAAGTAAATEDLPSPESAGRVVSGGPPLSDTSDAFGPPETGGPVEELYGDARGHWAEAVLIKAVEDGVLVGGDNGLLSPDDPITGAQMLTVLCRVLAVRASADLSGVQDVAQSDWYYDAAAGAVALGLVAPSNNRLNLDKPITRGRAFAVLAEAFQLVDAAADAAALAPFSDGEHPAGKTRPAAAALVRGGYVEGYGGALHMDKVMTRAEFLAVLYRIAPSVRSGDGHAAKPSEGVVRDGAPPPNAVFEGPLYIDCTPSDVRLQGLTAPSVVLRSGGLQTIEVTRSTIGRLVLAATGDITLRPDSLSDIGTVAVGTGSGKVSLGGAIRKVEITGDNRYVAITAPLQSLIISGSGNTVSIGAGIRVETLEVRPAAENNTVTADGPVGACVLYGAGTSLGGSGTVESLTDNAAGSEVTAQTLQETVNADFGLSGVRLTIKPPNDPAYYEPLRAEAELGGAAIPGPCFAAWYLDDVLIARADVRPGGAARFPLTHTPADRSAILEGTLSFVLRYTDADGMEHERRADAPVTLRGRTKADTDRLLATVKTGYAGDYTLAWAQANDYDDHIKAAWINAMGYDSATDYLIWISIRYQRVNIFSGEAGHWRLEKSFMAATGAAGHDTPTGVFKVIGRLSRGWTTRAYTVRPVVNFLNSAYAFHSRLYVPGTTKFYDSRIGFPVSLGCIRMYDEDVNWMYDVIPTGTTVVAW